MRPWSNGMIRDCQFRGPGSIPGGRIGILKKNNKTSSFLIVVITEIAWF